MNKLFKNSALLMMMVLVLFSQACKEDDEPTPEPSLDNVVNLANDATLGSILVDGNGNTLYFFTKDTDGQSKCEDGCLARWPIYSVEGLTVGNGLDIADFGEITRGDGEVQITYKGWPLYYFSPNGDGELEATGETSGEAVGNVWFVAKPDYSIMIADAQLVGQDGENYLGDYTVGEGETQYFVDGSGRTIYIWVNDTRNTNNFTSEDFSNDAVWPIFYAEIQGLPSTLDAADFGVITVHGRQQTTYKGWPLYYFGQDANRGENKGISVPAPGVWPIINQETAAATE